MRGSHPFVASGFVKLVVSQNLETAQPPTKQPSNLPPSRRTSSEEAPHNPSSTLSLSLSLPPSPSSLFKSKYIMPYDQSVCFWFIFGGVSWWKYSRGVVLEAVILQVNAMNSWA
jgi:hypothetical protein